MMINIQTITNVADCVPLYLPHSLYLKPLAKVNISVSLPANKMGKSISNLDIMEKLANALKPDKFLVLKVVKSTVEFIRFEAELEERSKLRPALSRIDGVSLKVNGFSNQFKVRASESKDEFPNRHDWDLFFRDATNMDEMKAGERPDTIYFSNLPIRWFCPRHVENDPNAKPSENIFKRIFEKFGNVRCVDIPICDIYRSKMNSDINGMRTHSLDQDVLFEGYVQFEEYVGFVRAMDEFRCMKLVRKFVDKTQSINIAVTFDKKKHLSDANIQRRERVRKRLISKAKTEKDEEERVKKAEQDKIESERKKQEQLKEEELERQREREEKRKEKQLKKLQEKGQLEISHKIRVEEKKLIIAQRKLESIRILEELFSRIKIKQAHKPTSSVIKRHTAKETKLAANVGKLDLRDKLVEKYKSATEKLLTKQKEKLQEIKTKSPLIRLLHKTSKDASNKSQHSESSNSSAGDDDQTEEDGKELDSVSGSVLHHNAALNPFKGGPYQNEMTNEWMKMSMFPYVPSVFPGMSVFRPNFVPHMNFRGYAPRIRGRGRGRGRGGGYEGYGGQSSFHSYNHNHQRDAGNDYDDNYNEDGNRNYHRKISKSYSRMRSKSRNRSRSRCRSRSRSRSRTRSRNRHYSKRSKSRQRSSCSRSRSSSRQSSWSSNSRSRSHSRSYSRSHRHNSPHNSKTRHSSKTHKSGRSRSKSSRPRKLLVSTRRSRSSTVSSRSRSRSRSKRSWVKKSDKKETISSSATLDVEAKKGQHTSSKRQSRSHSKDPKKNNANVIETERENSPSYSKKESGSTSACEEKKNSEHSRSCSQTRTKRSLSRKRDNKTDRSYDYKDENKNKRSLSFSERASSKKQDYRSDSVIAERESRSRSQSQMRRSRSQDELVDKRERSSSKSRSSRKRRSRSKKKSSRNKIDRSRSQSQNRRSWSRKKNTRDKRSNSSNKKRRSWSKNKKVRDERERSRSQSRSRRSLSKNNKTEEVSREANIVKRLVADQRGRVEHDMKQQSNNVNLSSETKRHSESDREAKL